MNHCPLRIVHPSTHHEWEVAAYYRQTYFFGKVPMEDPYRWTFGHPEHVHVVAYKGTKIIGYAHVQLWPEHRAAMRIIVIEEAHRRASFGGQLLQWIERWLTHHAYHSLHAESSPAALLFYTKCGYTPMPFDDPEGHEASPQDIAVGKRL